MKIREWFKDDKKLRAKTDKFGKVLLVLACIVGLYGGGGVLYGIFVDINVDDSWRFMAFMLVGMVGILVVLLKDTERKVRELLKKNANLD